MDMFNFVAKAGVPEVARHIREHCIHCNKCISVCGFLSNYSMDLSLFAKRPELAYECCLCDNCKRACPLGLSGHSLAIEHRQHQPLKYARELWLKEHYPFKSLPKRAPRRLLFFGCNFPLFFPETTKKLISMLAPYGVDYSIDCCRKPVLEMGRNPRVEELFARMQKEGIEELITVCPNCHHLFRDYECAYYSSSTDQDEDTEDEHVQKTLPKLSSIFEFLRTHGLGEKLHSEGRIQSLFIPCTDRDSLELFHQVAQFMERPQAACKRTNCCGLGGYARLHDPDFQSRCRRSIDDELRKLQKNSESYEQVLYTYCASCSSSISGYQAAPDSAQWSVRHVLAEIVGTHEQAERDYQKNALRFALRRYS